jgi:hypothetical protein
MKPTIQTKKIKWRKPRRENEIRVRYEADGTYVSAQDGSYCIFDHGDYQTLVMPKCPYLNCNRSGDGVIHVRIKADRGNGRRKNNIQVARLIMGLEDSDPRKVMFRNRNHRDLRKDNLYLVGAPPAKDSDHEQDEGASEPILMAAE